MAGKKFDSGKVPMHLLAPDVLMEEAEVMGFGEAKYGAWNWLEGMHWSRLVGAAMRHLLAWHSGESKDPETGFSHLAHCRCCLGMLMGYEKHGLGTDDRFSAALRRVLDGVDDGDDEKDSDKES